MAVTVQEVEAWVRDYAAGIAEHSQQLTRLDAAIGDGDHGTNMDRGMKAVVEKLDAGGLEDVGALGKAVGMALVSKVGGAAGPLYGTFFLRFGQSADGKVALEPTELADAIAAGLDGVQARGKAVAGDKTMVDALLPAVETLRAALGEGAALSDALARAADAADEGVRQTIDLVARKGRASYLGERSRGHQDPGATSSALLLRSAAETVGLSNS